MMWCEECGTEREVTDETVDTALDHTGRLEREYRVYELECGHEKSYPTGRTWQVY